MPANTPLGQRVAKTGSGVDTGAVYFVYDEAGHLLGEYDGTGAVIQETVWLGDLPVGVLKSGALYNVNPDHLGAPLTVTDATGQLVWRWDRDPYGNGKPNENPSGLGTFSYNLRFPGQYYDKETELHYNYFRDYNPKTGRYLQADPIGFAGGLNIYSYVNNDPVSRGDLFGLAQAVFNGNSIRLWSNAGVDLGTWPAISGSGGSITEVGRGPLPPGAYIAEPSSVQTASIFSPIWYLFGQGSWGTQRLPLIPLPETVTFGRSGFFIHGGTHGRTAGCIGISDEKSFFDAWQSTQEMLWLTVDYGS